MRDTSASGNPPCTNRVAHVCLRSWNFKSLMSAIRLAVAQDRFTVSVMPNTRVAASRCGKPLSSFSNRGVIGTARARKVLVFIAWMLMRLFSKSTSRQRSERISPRLMPVSSAHMMIARSRSRGPSQASSNKSSSAREITRVRFVSSEVEMIVSEPENGCRSIQPSRKAILSILRSTVNSLFTVAIDRCREGAFLNFTFASRRLALN